MMATIAPTEINTLGEFTNAIEDSLEKTKKRHEGKPEAPELIVNWYRGVGDAAKHKLAPSLFRHDEGSVDKLLEMEVKMLNQFSRRGSIYQPKWASNNDELDRLEQLFFMQHFGVPTRLLDWSENPYIGLYFALTSAKTDSIGNYVTSAAFWILDPIAWNQKSLGSSWGARGPLSAEDTLAHGYSPAARSSSKGEMDTLRDESAAIYGTYNNSRIAAQRGVFTIFGHDRAAMEDVAIKKRYPKECLSKLIVKPDNIARLLDSVVSLGFTDSASYPDLQGLALELKRYFKFPMS